MPDLRSKLMQRRQDQLYGRSELIIVGNLSSSDAKRFREEADNIPTRCITYQEKWYNYEGSIFKQMPVLSLKYPDEVASTRKSCSKPAVR